MECSNCQFDNREGAKFCNECDHVLSKPLVCIESVGASQPSDIPSDKSGQAVCFEGERRQATVVSGSCITTDGWPGYSALQGSGYAHRRMLQNKAENKESVMLGVHLTFDDYFIII